MSTVCLQLWLTFIKRGVYYDLMDSKEATRLIDAVGGDVAFAKLLGIDHEEGVAQRINNWKRRGMPAAVVLEHYHIIQHLKRRAIASAT